jgi:hypothetical protein
MKFNFYRFFLDVLAQMVKTASFSIQTASFEFKLKMWTNQRLTPHYGPGILAVIGTTLGHTHCHVNGPRPY